MRSFSKLYEALLKEINVKNIGIFPGKFKPPHKGHFKTCEVASKENDVVIVLISNKEHEEVTADTSLNIWNIYKKYLPNIIPFITTPTPVLATYDISAILNNGLDSIPTPKSNVIELMNSSRELESYINVGNGINLNLYSSPEDQERYRRILKEPYMGKNVLKIDFKTVDRATSATKFREALKSNNAPELFLPNIDKEDKINILKQLL